ncbi:bacteriocin immunity protein [Streptomyces sp. NPDC058700]|uniref:bacteriocin immunity protein n=1 Tax=Streptomyces sp. NPDC058700 TaxID=3346607 RepID=UPI003656AE95
MLGKRSECRRLILLVLTRGELIRLVEKIMEGAESEEDQDALIETLKRNVSHPRVLDLIFHPEDDEPTAEQVVDSALSYRPIEL